MKYLFYILGSFTLALLVGIAAGLTCRALGASDYFTGAAIGSFTTGTFMSCINFIDSIENKKI